MEGAQILGYENEDAILENLLDSTVGLRHRGEGIIDNRTTAISRP